MDQAGTPLFAALHAAYRRSGSAVGPGTPGSDGSGPDSPNGAVCPPAHNARPEARSPLPNAEVPKAGARFELLHGGDLRSHAYDGMIRERSGRPTRVEAPGRRRRSVGSRTWTACCSRAALPRGLAGGPLQADYKSWEGASVRLRLVYADDGTQVLPDPLIAFPWGSRLGEPCAELVLRLNGNGYSEQSFGVAASSFLHRRRRFRLKICDAEDAASVLDSVVVWGAAPAKRGQAGAAAAQGRPSSKEASKRPRVVGGAGGAGGGGGAAARRPPRPVSASLTSVVSSSSEWETEGGYIADEKAGYGNEEEELALQFQRAVHFYPDADPASEDGAGPLAEPPQPLPPGAPLRILPAGVSAGKTSPAPIGLAAPLSPSLPWPPPAPFSSPLSLNGMAAPYRHASAASRDGAAAMVHASHAAVGVVATSVGVAHPVRGNRPSPPRLLTACRDLAAALSNAEVFDSPLFRSREGRFRARRALEDLRLAGSSELLESVAAAWRSHILAAGSDPETGTFPGLKDPEDAALAAEHAWNAVSVLCGEARFASSDLFPVPRSYVFSLIEHADRLTAPHWEGRPALRCEAMRRRAWALEQWRESDAALELYFEAWSELIRAGETPSRQEAGLLCELADSLLRMPNRSHLGSHICPRLYWFCDGDEEDVFGEACAIRTLGWEAFMNGKWRNSRRHLERAAGILAPMSPGYRAPLERIFQTTALASFHVGDLSGVHTYARRSLAQASETYGFGYPEIDYTFNWLPWWLNVLEHKVRPGTMKREPKLEDVASNMRWSLLLTERVLFRGHALRDAVVGHAIFQLARAQVHCGEWAKALGSLARARSVLYDRYPAYFPPHSGRMENIRRMEAECRERSGQGAGQGVAAGAPPPAAAAPADPAPLAPAHSYFTLSPGGLPALDFGFAPLAKGSPEAAPFSPPSASPEEVGDAHGPFSPAWAAALPGPRLPPARPPPTWIPSAHVL
eukprot:tig00020723_g13499.t1